MCVRWSVRNGMLVIQLIIFSEYHLNSCQHSVCVCVCIANGVCVCLVLQEAVSTGDPEMVQLVLQRRDYLKASTALAGVPELLCKIREVRDSLSFSLCVSLTSSLFFCFPAWSECVCVLWHRIASLVSVSLLELCSGKPLFSHFLMGLLMEL